jgi:flagella basal body P-ring formation protein FlgA
MIWWIVFAMNLRAATCTPLHTDHILASDVARVVPEFAAVPPDTIIGYAPVAGSRRLLHAAELRRLATKFNVTLNADPEACFEWTVGPVSRDDIVRAMRESIELPDARIDIIETGTRAAPAGKIVFPLHGLIPAADRNSGPALWRGYVAYAERRRFDLWVRVKLSAPTSRVVAVTSISAGHVIEANEVRLETVEDYPIWHEVARHLDEVVGRVARRGIPAGRAVLRTELTQPLEIEAGETVEVNVESGQAHLTMQGRAENSGRRGEMISVRNPRSGKLFRARVEAKGKVLVMPGVTGGTVN